jgi:RNA polymerase sigma-70 factor (ECF subfamily)
MESVMTLPVSSVLGSAPTALADAADSRATWTDEARMLERYHAGDNAALDELVERYRTSAFWVSRYVVNDDDVANDVVQEAFVRVIERSDRYDPNRPFKAWFLQIVRNLSIDHLRRRRGVVGSEPLEYIPVHADFGALERRELAQRIQEVMATLPEKYRELIRLRDVEGYGSDEIAQIIGVDYGTTRWRIHQARKLFRQAWVARFGEEP